MERRRFGNIDLTVSIIGLGCYGMSGAYGPADDGESIATIRRALDLGVNFLDTSASYGQGHNHRVIGEGACRLKRSARWFADSPLEGTGFEPRVPPRRERS